MKIRLLWVGKTKERFVVDAVALYLKKLKPLAKVEVVEIKEQKGLPMEVALEREGKQLLGKVRPSGGLSGYCYFDQAGKQFSSTELAAFIKDRASIDFVIGGAYGVSQEVIDGADTRIAMSKMTFTHEMARVIALEQLYRALMINKGRSYHH